MQTAAQVAIIVMKMVKAFSCIKLVRPGNAAMASAAVALGYWLSGGGTDLGGLLRLAAAAFCAVGFGNAVNDLVDIDGDRINHPERPLPSGQITPKTAAVLAVALAIASCGLSGSVSSEHLAATAAPLILLAAYARFLKGTPLAGNVLVSLLVAYPLVYGAIGSTHLTRLIVPAVLAFLLNFCREIFKDIQDTSGDQHAGVRTTASLPASSLRLILAVTGLLYLGLLALPYVLGHYGLVYLAVCLVTGLPLHIDWMRRLAGSDWQRNSPAASRLLKAELLAGLVALGADRTFLPND